MREKALAFLFDMDGLLMDTEDVHIRAYMKLTQRLGKAQSFDSLKRFIGHSHHVTCKWLVEGLGFENPMEELIAWEHELYFQILDDEKPSPLPGVRELFDLGDELQLKRALVSSSIHKQVDPTMRILTENLKRMGEWKSHFQAICTGDRVQRLKPSPELYLLATKELNLDPRHCIAFEDSPAGVSAAHAAGCRVVAIPNMYLNAEEVSQGKAHYVFKTLAEAHKNMDAILN